MSHIYYYVLEGSRYLLADERNKKHLLDFILAAQKTNNWPVYAFCITDNSAYVITETDRASDLMTALQCTVRKFWQIYEGFPDDARRLSVRQPEQISSGPELARRCRAIHCLPLTLGYSSKPGDYWWSSYKTYLHSYVWGMVDCTILLRYFSEDPEQALRKFRQYHTGRGQNSSPVFAVVNNNAGKTQT